MLYSDFLAQLTIATRKRELQGCTAVFIKLQVYAVAIPGWQW